MKNVLIALVVLLILVLILVLILSSVIASRPVTGRKITVMGIADKDYFLFLLRLRKLLVHRFHQLL